MLVPSHKILMISNVDGSQHLIFNVKEKNLIEIILVSQQGCIADKRLEIVNVHYSTI